ncbi:MAG: S8 family serine peptidase, partial [Elusimicrobiota bacterium]|nr:S8 family serine peptidase [Elusimicrobiota bacterium]
MVRKIVLGAVAGAVAVAVMLLPLDALEKVKYFSPEIGKDVEVVAREILVKFKTGVSENIKGSIRASVRATLQEKISDDEDSVEVIKVEGDIKDVIEKFQKDPSVEFVEPNYIRYAKFTPNDTKFSSQWSITKTLTTSAWDKLGGSGYIVGARNVIIAVVDDGIDTGHSDLSGVLLPGMRFDGTTVTTNPSHLEGDIGHGTHVTGIAAAVINNSKGVAGVSNSKIIPVKVLGPDGGADSDVAKGIRWAAGLSVSGTTTNPNPAKVINLSLGGPGKSTTLESAVTAAVNKGAVVLAAAGNEAQDGNPIEYPGAYANSICVAATDKYDKRASFSEYNSYVDIAAPGVAIWSTLPVSKDNDDGTKDGYASWDGTSMATPFVSGLAALLIAAKPSITPAEIRSILQTTAVDLGTAGRDDYYGYGRVNTAAAVEKALGGGTVTPPPSSSVDGSGLAKLSKTSASASTYYTSLTMTLTPKEASLGGGSVEVLIPAGWQSPQNQYSTGKGYVKAYIYKYQTTSYNLTTSVSGQKVTITGIPSTRMKLSSGDSIKIKYLKFTTWSTSKGYAFIFKTAGNGGTLTTSSNLQPVITVGAAATGLSAMSETDDETTDEEGTVKQSSLGQNYPNPFNPSATFTYFIPEAGKVSIKLYNVAG